MPTPDLDAVVAAGRQAIAAATDLEELHEAEQAHLAKRSALGEVQRSLGGLVEAHDGRIWADSSPDQGTTLRFRLPRGGLELAGIT